MTISKKDLGVNGGENIDTTLSLHAKVDEFRAPEAALKIHQFREELRASLLRRIQASFVEEETTLIYHRILFEKTFLWSKKQEYATIRSYLKLIKSNYQRELAQVFGKLRKSHVGLPNKVKALEGRKRELRGVICSLMKYSTKLKNLKVFRDILYRIWPNKEREEYTALTEKHGLVVEEAMHKIFKYYNDYERITQKDSTLQGSVEQFGRTYFEIGPPLYYFTRPWDVILLAREEEHSVLRTARITSEIEEIAENFKSVHNLLIRFCRRVIREVTDRLEFVSEKYALFEPHDENLEEATFEGMDLARAYASKPRASRLNALFEIFLEEFLTGTTVMQNKAQMLAYVFQEFQFLYGEEFNALVQGVGLEKGIALLHQTAREEEQLLREAKTVTARDDALKKMLKIIKTTLVPMWFPKGPGKEPKARSTPVKSKKKGTHNRSKSTRGQATQSKTSTPVRPSIYSSSKPPTEFIDHIFRSSCLYDDNLGFIATSGVTQRRAEENEDEIYLDILKAQDPIKRPDEIVVHLLKSCKEGAAKDKSEDDLDIDHEKTFTRNEPPDWLVIDKTWAKEGWERMFDSGGEWMQERMRRAGRKEFEEKEEEECEEQDQTGDLRDENWEKRERLESGAQKKKKLRVRRKEKKVEWVKEKMEEKFEDRLEEETEDVLQGHEETTAEADTVENEKMEDGEAVKVEGEEEEEGDEEIVEGEEPRPETPWQENVEEEPEKKTRVVRKSIQESPAESCSSEEFH